MDIVRHFEVLKTQKLTFLTFNFCISLCVCLSYFRCGCVPVTVQSRFKTKQIKKLKFSKQIYIISKHECSKMETMYKTYNTALSPHSCLPTFDRQTFVVRYLTENIFCEFLAFDGVNLQSVHQSFLKTPVYGTCYCKAY